MSLTKGKVCDKLSEWARAKPAIDRLWLFGSVARIADISEEFTPGIEVTDIDILVEWNQLARAEVLNGDCWDDEDLWCFLQEQWTAELAHSLGLEQKYIALRWLEPEGRTPTLEKGLRESSVLLLEGNRTG